MPRTEDIDIEGLSITRDKLEELRSVDPDAVKAELLAQEELFLNLAGDLPKEMVFQRVLLISRLYAGRRDIFKPRRFSWRPTSR